MVALDISVLLYAVNRYAPEHPRAARVVEELIHGGKPWGVPSPVLAEFIRGVTHPHAVARPLGAAEAVGFLSQIVEAGNGRVLAPGERFLETLRALVGPRGEEALPPGVEIAAILREHGVRELLSCDSSVRRYRFLTVTDPVHGEPWHPDTAPARRYRTLITPPAR